MSDQWDLFRRGELDKQAHHNKVRKAVQENLSDLIAHDAIIDGTGRVRIPIKELKQYRFKYADGQESGIGSGRPGTKKGDTIGRIFGDGQEGEAGTGHETGYYEVWVNADDVAEVLFADLELPDIREKQKTAVVDLEPRWDDIRKKGPLSNIDKRRTILENIKRNATLGRPGFGDLTDDDLRFRAVDMKRGNKDQVVVIFIRDRSGSMDEQKKEITRIAAYWIHVFLRHKYRHQIETAYILHDSEAEIVDEDTFFHQTQGGGTMISSAYKLLERMLIETYKPSAYNIYVVHFTDGENWSSDDEEAVSILGNVLDGINLFAYWEIRDIHTGLRQNDSGYFMSSIKKHLIGKYSTIDVWQCNDHDGIIDGIRHFFRNRGKVA